MLTKLKELAEKKTLTAQDKEYILTASKELGIEFTPKSDCPNCYFDQIFVIKAKLEEKEQPKEDKKAVKCDYELDPELKIDWIDHDGVRINKHTMTNELGKTLVDRGLARIFVKMPNENKQ